MRRRDADLHRTIRRFNAKANAIFQRLGPLDHAKLSTDAAMHAFTLQGIAERCQVELREITSEKGWIKTLWIDPLR